MFLVIVSPPPVNATLHSNISFFFRFLKIYSTNKGACACIDYLHSVTSYLLTTFMYKINNHWLSISPRIIPCVLINFLISLFIVVTTLMLVLYIDLIACINSFSSMFAKLSYIKDFFEIYKLKYWTRTLPHVSSFVWYF